MADKYYKKSVKESDLSVTNVDDSHTIEEYMDRFGDEYKNGNLWDFSEEDFWEDAVEYRWDIVYWKIGDRYYETDIPYETIKESKEEDKLETFEDKMDFLAKDEQEAIDGYDKVIALLDAEKDAIAIEQLNKIKFEEKAHKKYLEDVKENHELVYTEPLDDNFDLMEAKKKRKNTKLHVQFPAGNPARNAEIFNHMMGSDVGTSSGEGSEGVSFGESLVEAAGKNDWNKICSDFLEMVEFELAKHEGEDRKSTDEYGDEYEGTWSLVDLQSGGNIGDIEAFRFDDAETMFDRMGIYIDDYILGDESVGYDIDDEDYPEDGLDTCEDIVKWYNDDMAKKYPSKAGYVELCDLIANHAGDVDLEKVYELQGGESTATSNSWYLPTCVTRSGNTSYLYFHGEVEAWHCDENLAKRYLEVLKRENPNAGFEIQRISSLDPNTKYHIIEASEIEDEIADRTSYMDALDFENKLSEKEDEIRAWLSEHDQALKDILNHYSKEKLEDVDFWNIIDWIEDHRELANDFKNKFGFAISMYENLNEATHEEENDYFVSIGMMGVMRDVTGEYVIYKSTRDGNYDKGSLGGLTKTDIRQLKQAIDKFLNKEIK